MTETDFINQPEHYIKGDIESIDVIKAFLTPEEFKGFCKGNAIKYLLRAGDKDVESQDLAKARNYVNMVLEGEWFEQTIQKRIEGSRPLVPEGQHTKGE